MLCAQVFTVGLYDGHENPLYPSHMNNFSYVLVCVCGQVDGRYLQYRFSFQVMFSSLHIIPFSFYTSPCPPEGAVFDLIDLESVIPDS